jgi:hypothetical protein
MNEKIKQLWDNSIEEFSKQHQYATIMLPEPLREKFAELIVRECAQVCVEVGDANSDIYPEFGNGAYFSANRVKEHFGVEE